MKTTKQSLSVFAIVLSLLISGNSFGQKSNFGIKAGLNSSRIITNDANFFIETESKLGFEVFLSYDFFNSKSIVLSAETGFNQKGFKSQTTYTNEVGVVTNTGSITENLNYLDVSGNFKYITRGKSASPYLSLTPTLGVYLGHSSSGSIPEDSVFVNTFNPITDSLNSVSFGIKIGLGVELNSLIKNVPLVFEVRYNPDLTQAYDKNSLQIRNSTVEFNLGVKF